MQGSLSHNNSLPQAFYSSGILRHRSEESSDWQAQILVGTSGIDLFLIWIEYAEPPTESIDKIHVGNYQETEDSFESAINKVERRGYIIEDFVIPNAAKLEEMKNNFYSD